MSSNDWKQLAVLVNRLRSLNPIGAAPRAVDQKPRPDRRSLIAALAEQLPAVSVDYAVLSDVQLQRAGGRALPAQLLTEAGSDTERAYLLKAFAAGHDVLTEFATQIQGRPRDWLDQHLSLGLARPTSGGPVEVDGSRVAQPDQTTCASVSIAAVRALADPLYALGLTTGPGRFDERLAAELRQIHEVSTRGQLPGIPPTPWNRAGQWPHGLGTPPWGMTTLLNSYRDATGTKYRTQLVDDYAGGNSAAALSAVESAVDAGTPVPIYTGDGVPRHVMVVLGHRDATLQIYEPSSGQVVIVTEHDFTDGSMRAAGGWPHVSFVLIPAQ